MGELHSALDALATDDLHALGAGALLDRTAELVAAANRIAAELARTVRVADLTQAPEYDGTKTMRSWLRGHVRLSPTTAGRIVSTGRALEHLPATATAFSAGQITAEQATLIAGIATPQRRAAAAEQGVDLGAIDALLAELAQTHPHTRLGQVVHHYLTQLDADGPEPDPTEGRSLSMSRHHDGTLTFHGHLDAVGGEKLQAAIEAILQASRPAGDLRTRAQQQGDALVQLADNALAAGTLPFLRTVKPHIGVLIPLADLLDPTTGPGAGTTGFGAAISAARARWLACDSNITRIVMGPEGTPLDFGRRPLRRVPPRACERWGAEGSFHSPAATPPATGATSTTSWNGCWTRGRRHWRTRRCCANATVCPGMRIEG